MADKTNAFSETKRMLLDLKEGILKQINLSLSSNSEASGNNRSGDIYDQASSERDRELGLLLGDREREKLLHIEEAIQKIDDGEYGICEECEEEIPIGRLKIVPFARHCVRCLTEIEQQQAQIKRVEGDRSYKEISLLGDEETS